MKTTLDEKQINALFERGNNFIRMGNLVQAVNDYDQVIAHRPDFAPAYFNRAFARQHGNQDVPGAIADYTRALELRPHFAQAFLNRAIAHKQNDDLHAALTDYQQAIGCEPNSAQAYNNRGEVYFLLGDYAAAGADFQQAHHLKAGYTHAIAGQAIACHALGEIDQARQFWQGLIAHNAHFRDLDWVRQELAWDAPLVDEAQKVIALC